MTNAGLMEKLRNLIDNAKDADKKHIRKLRKVLRKLKHRQIALHEELEAAVDPRKRRQLEQEIAVIELQRGKGVGVYKQLKTARKMSGQDKLETFPVSPGGDDAGNQA